ncbi:AAA family ATPase, partial [bacterium]|nr:AAA family ATPase [bacterium]
MGNFWATVFPKSWDFGYHLLRYKKGVDSLLKQELITFANCLSEAFSSGRISTLNNFSLRMYLPLLKLKSLKKLYESIQQASNSQRQRLDVEIPNLVANEIVFRTLVKIPRDFAPLKEFLAASFPEDPLLHFITRILPLESPPLYPTLKDLLDFDLTYLDALKNLLAISNKFSSAIQKVLSRFANKSYFVNLLFVLDKDFSGMSGLPARCKQIITEHFLDGFLRQVVTDRQTAYAGAIFDESSQVDELFVDTATRAQKAMGDYLGQIDFYRYQFVEDEETPLFLHEGSSGGLAFAELYYLAHTSLRSPLAPYTAFLGVLNEKQEVRVVANLEAKIEAAKENGIRLLILPERNQERVSPEEEYRNLHFLSYREGVFSDVFSQIDALRKEHGFLPENNLPERHSRFIGREQEISEIQDFLKKERIVNLIGTGGVGKTRLAEQVAAELLPSFPDGVWFVDLASLRDANLVLPTISSVLSIQPQPRTPLQQQITDFLKTKRLLLVLDNFEQLPHKASTLIEELIQNTEFVRCLVTSRDVSTCPDGNQFLVAPLDIPQPEARLLIDSVDSVKLFLSHAEELGQPLAEEFFPTVAQLCRILDGIPLAIELAAARLVDLSPKEILSRIK